MLPEGWKLKCLGDFCKFSQGFQIGVENHLDVSNENTVRFIRIVDYTRDNEPPRFIEKNPNHYTVSVDDLVMMRYGDAGFLSRGIEGVIANNMFLINPDLGIATKEFLYEILKSKYKIISAMAASSTMPAIKFTDIKPFNILLPPLPEQKKIAQILSTWDNAISATERLLENSQQRKKALMQQLLTGKKRLPGFEGEWTIKKIGSLIREVKKENVSNANLIELLTVKLHYKGVVKSGKYPTPTERGRPYFKRNFGELIIGRQNLHNGGVAVVPKECDGLIASNAISSFNIINGSNVHFILLIVSTSRFRFLVDVLAGGTGQKEIGTRDLLNIKVSVPTANEQQAIANVLTTADQEIDALQKRLGHLKQEKKALMQQLLTGKRRVQVEDAA